MKEFKFGKKSMRELDTCHDDLQIIAYSAIALSPIDFGISEGHRSLKKQKKAFDEGKSKIDGVTKKGKHNHYPSLAFDFYAYVNGKAMWEPQHLCTIAGVIIATANILFIQGDIEHQLRWGADWNMNSEILSDQAFDDIPHLELYKPK